MALNTAQKEVAVKIGQLLAESPLDDEIKTAILNGIDGLPENMIFKLLDALETEQDELERIAFEIELFLKQQDLHWAKVQGEQQKVADILADKWVEKLK